MSLCYHLVWAGDWTGPCSLLQTISCHSNGEKPGFNDKIKVHNWQWGFNKTLNIRASLLRQPAKPDSLNLIKKQTKIFFYIFKQTVLKNCPYFVCHNLSELKKLLGVETIFTSNMLVQEYYGKLITTYKFGRTFTLWNCSWRYSSFAICLGDEIS